MLGLRMNRELWERLNRRRIELDRSDSTSSPPPKRSRRRHLTDFRTAKELKKLESLATEVVELKDYAEWFLSKCEAKTSILYPVNYFAWINTLDNEAKKNVIIDPDDFVTWYDYFLVQGKTVVPSEEETDTWPTEEEKNKKYAEIALTHFNRESSEDYEYTRHKEIIDCEVFVHLNFFARLKVSESRIEPGPEEYFFAEVKTQKNEVTRCCIINLGEFMNLTVEHPPDIGMCSDCLEYDDGFACFCFPSDF